MNSIITFLIIINIINIISILPPEKSEELLHKYTKKISLENLDVQRDSLNTDNLQEEEFYYDPKTIKDILDRYQFKQTFNFLEEHNITPKVKSQNNCKCGWALSAASALSYRFKLKGLDNFDLSPQYSLSCYLPDCKAGNNLIDPQLNLIKNGTVTEECLPFSSGNGTIIDKCPEKCKNGSELYLYYAQSAYLTEGLLSNETYYDIVTLILDQIINKGPVVSRLSLHQDFIAFIKNKEKCKNEIYRYDGQSPFSASHAVIIVGYGFSNNRYYWLIQNTLGTDSCDNGFMKIEFGQIGIENVAFSEPYIEQEGKIPYEIKLTYNKIKENCDLDISYKEDDLNKWENTLDINFRSEDDKNEFNIQCGVMSSVNIPKRFACYYEEKYINYPIQKYKYKGYQSFGNDNRFTFESTSQIKDFTFYGYQHIYSNQELNKIFFVSEEGSKAILFFQQDEVGKDYLPPIYANYKSSTPLSDCKKLIIQEESQNFNLIICTLKKEEINYFDEYNERNHNSMVYDILCGKKQSAENYVYKLDKTKYPVFRINKIYLEKSGEASPEKKFNIEATVEGNIPGDFKKQDFIGFSILEYNKVNITYQVNCVIDKLDIGIKEFNITCAIQVWNEERVQKYDNLYILPYIIPYNLDYPYEVILKDIIKPEDDTKPDPLPGGFSNNLEISLMVLFLILFLI